MYFYMDESPHSGLYRFGTEYVGGVLATNNMFDAEPVGQPYDRTEIAGVLYPVEGKD